MNNNGCRIDSLFPVNPRAGFTGALRDNNVLAVKNIVEAISYFQSKFAGYPLPSGSRIKAEIMYYKLGIFEKLFLFYVLTGIMMLIVLLAGVTSAGKKSLLLIRFPSMILRVGFVFHSAGLALRWYVSGHFPASNGYETMIFISWVTILAGMVYNRRAPHTLAATACLSGIILLVARMSYIDPEITNLVPVLKSRWLTLHVSVVTGSYGFLGLGAILALVNMIMLSVCKERNRERISATIDVLTLINYKSLNIGLSLFTAGTLLGAVWANTSWGSYWSWDPKETWSLITIIVYTFVTHSILIPGLKDIFSYNFLSLYAFSSVLMTYFGVNYYLTGLHSYASGDPFSMPALVYIIIAAIATITFIAYTRYRSMDKARLN
jgi:cytochrome c-type biogenesis protein CcsB